MAREGLAHLRRYLDTLFVPSRRNHRQGKPIVTTATMLERSKPYASVEHVKIYWIKAQAPRRVLALVKYLGLEAEFVEVDMMGGGFKKPNYVALNPNMKAPTLVDGDLVLWEFLLAIMAHLCVKAGSNMWPANTPAEQVQVSALAVLER